MFSRRHILQTVSAGFGYLAFSGISSIAAGRRAVGSEQSDSSNNPLAPKAPHFPARAKRVIFLCMQGGPSHVDTFDYKPQLARDHGKRGKYGGSLLKSPWDFQQHGEGGLWISDLLPEIAKQADELCLLRGMHTDQPIHPRALTQMHTGTAQFIRPSLGAWTLYGLGSENDSLPGFVSINPPAGTAQNYGSAFLPAIYQGTKIGRSIGRRGQRFDVAATFRIGQIGERLCWVNGRSQRKLVDDHLCAWSHRPELVGDMLLLRKRRFESGIPDRGRPVSASHRQYGVP